MTKTTTKTKTQTKCLKNPTYAIFLKSWWLTHSKYDDRYLTLAILFTPVTLVTLFRSYDQFYRAECITVSGFFGGGSLLRANYQRVNDTHVTVNFPGMIDFDPCAEKHCALGHNASWDTCDVDRLIWAMGHMGRPERIFTRGLSFFAIFQTNDF